MDDATDVPHEPILTVLPPQTTYDKPNVKFYGAKKSFSLDYDDEEIEKKLTRKEKKKFLYQAPKTEKKDNSWNGYERPNEKPKSYEDHTDWADWREKPYTMTTIVTRERWGAVEPLSMDPVEGPPLEKVLAFYTGMDACFNKEECCEVMRKLQKHYMEEWKLADIPWNFLIGCDGRVYEGRGWGFHPKKVNSLYKYRQYDRKSYDIAYIGPYFKGRKVPGDERSLWPKLSFLRPMFYALRVLVTTGVKSNFIDDEFGLQSEINC